MDHRNDSVSAPQACTSVTCPEPDTVGCPHASLIECVRTLSNGSVAWGMQCKRCGCWSARKKSEFKAEPTATYEPAIRDEYEDAQRMAWQGAVSQHQAENAQLRSDGHAAWLIEHDAYLATDEWKKKREAILERDGGICRGCLRRPATQVHHLTYAHWKNELAFELISLCKLCHEKAHNKELKGAA